jgi:hypothetical protein
MRSKLSKVGFLLIGFLWLMQGIPTLIQAQVNPPAATAGPDPGAPTNNNNNNGGTAGTPAPIPPSNAPSPSVGPTPTATNSDATTPTSPVGQEVDPNDIPAEGNVLDVDPGKRMLTGFSKLGLT